MKDLRGERGSGGYFPFFVGEGGVSVFVEVSALTEEEELSALTEDEEPSTFTEEEELSSIGGGEALFCSFKFYA